MVEAMPERQGFVEPTEALPSWGDHAGRSAGAAALLLIGAVLIAQTSSATVTLGLLGSALHVTGWLVLPGRRLTRAAVAAPGMLTCWVTISGPKAMWLLALLLLFWLLVRQRPLITFALVALPLVAGLLLAEAYSAAADKTVAFTGVAAAVVAGAVLARAVAVKQELGRREGDPIAGIEPRRSDVA